MFSFFGSLLEFLDIVWTSGCSLCGLHMWPGQLTHCCYLPKGGRAQMIQQKPDLQVYFWNWFNNLTYKCSWIQIFIRSALPHHFGLKWGTTFFKVFWEMVLETVWWFNGWSLCFSVRVRPCLKQVRFLKLFLTCFERNLIRFLGNFLGGYLGWGYLLIHHYPLI